MGQDKIDLYSYDPEEEDLRRRQSVLNAMSSSAMQPLQPSVVGNQAAAPHWTSALAKMLQAYIGTKGQEALSKEAEGLMQRRAEETRQGFEAFDKTSRGGWDGVAAGEAGPPQLVSGDKRKAIFDALASRSPMLRQFAMQQLTAEGKDRLTLKDLLPHAAASAIPAMLQQGMAGFKPKADLGEVGGILYNKDNLEAVPLGGPRPEQTTLNGDLYEKNPSTGQWKKLDNAPKVSTHVSVGGPVIQGENAFMKEIGQASAKDAIAAKQAKVAAERTIQSMQKLDQLEAQGVYSGPAADIAIKVGAFADSTGIPVDKKKLANSQAYTGEVMAQLSHQLTGSLAKSTTDKDMEILKAPMPQLLNSAEGRAALRRQAVAKAKEQIEYADAVQKNLMRQFPEAGRLFGVAPGQVAVPQREDVGQPAVRRFNPATGRIE